MQDGLLPERMMCHKIEVASTVRPPHRLLFHFSLAELKAARDYVDNLPRKKKIEPSNSRYGPIWFVLRERDNLRGMLDWNGLHRIRERNKAALTVSDEMFNWLGAANSFSTLGLKTSLPQIQSSPHEIENTAFNTDYCQFEWFFYFNGFVKCNWSVLVFNEPNSLHFRSFCFVLCMEDFPIFWQKWTKQFLNPRNSSWSIKQAWVLRVSEVCELKNKIDSLDSMAGKHGLKMNPERKKI